MHHCSPSPAASSSWADKKAASRAGLKAWRACGWRFSNYNNAGGFKNEQLDNKSFQVALPVGVQWDIIKGKQFGISAEATVQPTYSFNSNVFLLSTDFKNYTDGNDFVRRWNINTSAGIHVNFKSGSNLWQLGPQIRYQHLPTYTNRYPIKEYLMDYGIRLAFTKQR